MGCTQPSWARASAQGRARLSLLLLFLPGSKPPPVRRGPEGLRESKPGSKAGLRHFLAKGLRQVTSPVWPQFLLHHGANANLYLIGLVGGQMS